MILYWRFHHCLTHDTIIHLVIHALVIQIFYKTDPKLSSYQFTAVSLRAAFPLVFVWIKNHSWVSSMPP